MFWVIKKLILIGIIGLIAYGIFAENGFNNIKKFTNDIIKKVSPKNEIKGAAAIESEELKKKLG